MSSLQNRRRHHRAHNTYNLLDENEREWEKIVATYKNNKENREKFEQQKITKGKDIQ